MSLEKGTHTSKSRSIIDTEPEYWFCPWGNPIITDQFIITHGESDSPYLEADIGRKAVESMLLDCCFSC